MAYCDVCGNFDDEHTDGEPEIRALEGYQPSLYYYWDGDFCDEDYDWRRKFPKVAVSYTHLTLPTNREV